MRLKTILIVAAGVLLVVVVAVVVALRSIDFNKYKGLVAEQVKVATGRELRIGGNLDLRIGFSPAVVVEDVSFANAPWGSRPEMAKVHRFEVEVALFPLILRDIRVKRLILVQPDILLETDGKGVGNWSLGDAAAPPAPPATKPSDTKAGLAAIAVEKVRIEQGALTYRDGRTKQTTSLALDRLDLRAKNVTSPLAIDFAGAFRGKAFTLAGTVGPLAELLAPSRPYPVKLSLKAGGATVEVDGAIAKPMEAAGLDIKVAVESKDMRSAAKAFGVDLPSIPPLSAAARVRDAQGTYALDDLKVAIGKSNLAGNGAISMGGARPKVKAQLASALLDLFELFPKGGSAQKGPSASHKVPEASKDKRVLPAIPLPLGGLKAADADLDLKVDRLVLPNKLSVEALAARLVLSGGRLEVQPLSARVGGGAVAGRMNLDAPTGKTAVLAAKVDARGIDLGQVLRQMGNPDLVTGAKTDFAVNLRGSGGSVRDVFAGLNGDVLLVLGEGKIHAKFVEWLGADLLTQVVERVNPFRKTDPYTELKCGVVRFAARDGIALTDKGIAFETGKMTLVSSGTANLKTEAIDFSLRPDARQVGGIGAGELVKLLRVRGTLGEPKFGIDELEAAKSVASLGAAMMTGGLSFLAEGLAKRATADPRPCETALGRTPAPARAASAPSATAPAGQPPAKPASPVDQIIRGLFGK